LNMHFQPFGIKKSTSTLWCSSIQSNWSVLKCSVLIIQFYLHLSQTGWYFSQREIALKD